MTTENTPEQITEFVAAAEDLLSEIRSEHYVSEETTNRCSLCLAIIRMEKALGGAK